MGGEGQRWGECWATRGVLCKDMGSGQRYGGLCRALHVVWGRLQGSRRRRRAVVGVQGVLGGRVGSGRGWPGWDDSDEREGGMCGWDRNVENVSIGS